MGQGDPRGGHQTGVIGQPRRDWEDTLKIARRQLMHLTVGAAILPAATHVALGQSYPSRPLTMVVPFAAGGAADVAARTVAPRLSEILGQHVIVENIGGAGGMTGASRVARAAPDGYQFVYGNTGTHAINQTLYKKPPYNPVTDFAPVGMFQRYFLALVARKDLPANTLPEFIAYAKANQAKMHYVSSGPGTTTHIACALLNTAMGTNISHVPYRSTVNAMPDMFAGRIDFICDDILNAAPHVQGGAIKAIAFLGTSRTRVLPNLATAIEQGLSGFDVSGWSAWFLPKGTPPVIVQRLSAAVSETMDTPSVRERIEGFGYSIPPPEHRTPEHLAKLLPLEIEKWAAPIRASGVSID
jgi:tripartite-type tricarboxylate transporter receptor subunit TctC